MKKRFALLILVIYILLVLIPIAAVGINQVYNSSSIGRASNYIIYPQNKDQLGIDIRSNLTINSINPTNATANISLDIQSEASKELKILQLRTDLINEIMDDDKIMLLDKIFNKIHKDESRYLMNVEVLPLDNGNYEVTKLHSASMSEKTINLDKSVLVLGHYNYTIPSIDISLDGNGMYFPFDTYKGVIVINFDPKVLYTTQYYSHIQLKNLDSNMKFEVNPSEWRREMNSKEEYEKQNYVQLYLRRNNFVRYYMPISIIVMYIIILLYMAIVRFESTKEMGVITVAVMTLIFTTRGLSVANGVPNFNIMDIIHIINSALLFLIVLIKYFCVMKNYQEENKNELEH